MCGIYGFVSYGPEPLDVALLARMSETLVHRGPDGDGMRVRDGAGLGCRRLAIIDVGGGAQPLSNEDDDVVVVCNGEIYNHRVLRDELLRRGHRFRTASDAEVLPHLYEEDGLAFVDRLEGMFAIALWDARAGRLVLARDRIGEKPLFYAVTPSALLFASEPKAILATGLVRPTADGAAVTGFLRTGYVATPQSGFAGVGKLVPGARLVAEHGRVRIEPFWELTPRLAEPALDLDLDGAARALRHALEHAVDAALVSDVPVGVFLSGGLDSTSVATIARDRLGPSLDTFTLGFDVPSFDERSYANEIAATLGTRHHVVMVTPERFLEGLRRLAPLLDEPISDQSLVPTYLLACEARSRVKVVLVGEGSDELFAGYPTYIGGLWAARYNGLPPGLRRAVRALAPRLGAPHGNVTLRYLLRRFIEMADASPEVRHRAWTGCIGPDGVAALTAAGGPLVTAPAASPPPARSLLDLLLGLDLTGYLRDDLLTNLDRATMAASLEGRAPFLNHHLVELACRLAPELKLRGLVGKRVLRRAMADVVPRAIRWRIKRGLAVPLATWLAGPLLPFARETLARLDPAVVRPAVVRQLLADHVARRRDNRRELWALLVLQLWVDANGVRWPERAEPAIHIARPSSAAAAS